MAAHPFFSTEVPSDTAKKMGSEASKFASPRYSEVVAPGDATHSPTYRNKKYVGGLVPTAFPEVRTMYDAFERGLKVNPTGRCMGSRVDTGATKEETDERGRKKVGWGGHRMCALFTCY